jgi:hypothetical protein
MQDSSTPKSTSHAVSIPAIVLRLCRSSFTVRHSSFHICLLLSAFCLLPGCASYQFGNRSLFPTDIQTVYVPMVQSESFRAGLGETLTEAICKEIEATTPYKVVGSPNADSILTAKIINDTKRVIVENKFDEPRSTDVNYQIQVTWTNRRNGIVREPQMVPLPPGMVELGQSAPYIPEYGHSYTTAEQQLITRLAEQIVGLMEVPW